MQSFRPKIPFNIELLILQPDNIRRLKEIKTKDIFLPSSTLFHPDGLYSTEIFGPPGTTERMSNFAYINLYVKVLHPLIYRHLISLSSLYKDILAGKKYVIFDNQLKDFIEVPIEEGHTGYEYFMQHYDQIQFKETNSETRKNKIEFLKKYKANQVQLDKYLVIPAGMRDYIRTESGKELDNEINNLYRKLLTVAFTAKQFSKSNTNVYNPFLNTVRNRLQKVVLDIYEYIENILDGKEGFIQGKWLKRRLVYSTFNVATIFPHKSKHFRSHKQPKVNDVIFGLFQYTKAITPLAIYQVRTKFLSNIFSQETYNAYLVDPDTFTKTKVELTEKSRATWVTDEGLEGVINKLIQDEIKTEPIIIDGNYLLLVYDDNKTIMVLQDINQLPDGYDRKYVRPITYAELFYLSVFDTTKRVMSFVTRYPITGFGSIMPHTVYLRTTNIGREVEYVSGLYGRTKLYEYPNLKVIKSNKKTLNTNNPYICDGRYCVEAIGGWFNGISISEPYMTICGGDIDGDALNATVIMEDEAVEELRRLLKDPKFYIGPDGKPTLPLSDDINESVVLTWTE